MLRPTLLRIATGYLAATRETYERHEMAQAIRDDLPKAMRMAMGPAATGLLTKGSAGQGGWVGVPWAAAFETSVTENAQHGYYVVYLFDAVNGHIYLSLNQGTTAVKREFGRLRNDVLTERANIMRLRLPEHRGRFPVRELLLEASDLGRGYAAGHALGLQYDAVNLPTENQLALDLSDIVRAYRQLVFRGGIELGADVDGNNEENDAATVIERRRYRSHRRIERNSRASRMAKAHHGCNCQVCKMAFAETYGEIGHEFIEAHHLVPIGDLAEDVPVAYDIAEDFAVLCANCHRMIHRMDDPTDLGALRALLR